MANDNRPEIVLDGDISPFRQKLREAGEALKRMGSDAEKSVGGISGPLDALQSKFVAIGALLAGGAVFKEAVTQAAQAAEESIKLGRALGISASEASVLREALEAGNTSQEEFVGAAKGLAKQIRENEEALQGMGLQTRDAAGQLRPLNDLVLEGIDVVKGYRAGTDRAIAGQTMFGKGFEMTSNLAEMNREAVAGVAEQMQALGTVTSQESVAAWQAFDDAGDKANIVLKGIKVTIGNALMPVLAQLGEWFAAIGPAAITVIRGAIGGLVALFWGLKTAAVIAWNAIALQVEVATINVLRFADMAKHALKLDFDGARQAWEQGSLQIEEVAQKRLRNVMDSAEETREKLWNLFAPGTSVDSPEISGKSATGLLKTGEDKKGKAAEDPSFMAVYEARLAEIKNAYEQENVLRQYSKEQELEYWRELQQNYQLTNKDRLTIAKRTATLELEIRRQSAKEQRDLDSTLIDSRRAAALAQIQLAEQQAGFARENEAITQRELISMQEGFARRRFEIEYQSLLERLELAKLDPNTSPAELARIKEQLLEVERSYLLRRGELQQAVLVEERQIWNSFTETISGLWDKGVNALMNGTLTWRNAWRAVLTEMTAWFATEVVGKQVKDWIAGKARLLAVELGFSQAKEAAETASAAKSVSTATASVTPIVGANAAKAGSGAAGAVADIPIVGPMMALAAMATVFAAVMALGNRKSAAGGFDIPKGLNPLTQLHEEEMVLPSSIANPLRNKLLGGEEQGGGSAGGPPIVLNFHSAYQDRAGIRRLLMDNGPALADAIRKAARNGN